MQDTLFYQDAYQKEFDAVVLHCEKRKKGFTVVLSQTVFYPEGGGQPGDTGTLNGVRVWDTQEQTGQIVHFCEAPLPVGETVHGILDWERRFRHMQSHTGEHIFSGIAHARYGCNNVGFHMSADCVTIDLDQALTAEQVAEIERETNAAVFADVPTVVQYPDEETLQTLAYRSKKELTGTVRLVEAGGRDLCACCGLHVARSGEVGCVKVGTQTPHRGGIRMTLLIGWDALADYDTKHKQVTAIYQTLSAKPNEVVERVQQLAERNDAYKAQIVALQDEIFRLRAQQLPQGEKKLWQFAEDLTPVEIRRFADVLAEQTEWAAVFTETAENNWQYAICSHTFDVRPSCQALNAALQGHGGGKPALVQGAIRADRAQIEAFCEGYQEAGWKE